MSLPEPLLIFAFAGEGSIPTLLERVFPPRGDRVFLTSNEREAVDFARAEPPDLAFIDLSFDHQAGLALVHHLRAITPKTAVIALTLPDKVQLGTQAMALGSEGIILLPASGDELVSAATSVRQRQSTKREHDALLVEVDLARRVMASVAKIAELAEVSERQKAASRLAEIFVEATDALGALVYIRANDHENRLIRVGVVGEFAQAPAFADEMGVMSFAQENGHEIIALSLGPLIAGHVILAGMRSLDERGRLTLDLMANQAASLLSFLTEREKATRGAIQDLTTSAYTFSYFVDIAGREIDKARRYDRRFALATIALDESSSPERAAELVELVLATVRDTDVLARVDEHEFYLLLPETDGLGAERCRRRLLAKMRESDKDAEASGQMAMGLAVFPHDGSDLSKLLRVAKRRAETQRSSPVHRLGLHALSLDDLTDALLKADEGDAHAGPKHLDISLAEGLALATTAIAEARRGGEALIVALEHEGMGLASAVRSATAQERDKVELHIKRAADLAGDGEALELMAVIAEHGAYAFVGRSHQGRLRAIHAADPLLADLLVQRLAGYGRSG